MNQIIKIAALIIIIAGIAFVVVRGGTPKEAAQPAAAIVYACNNGKSINTLFYIGEKKPAAKEGQPPTPGGSVALKLSDGREMTLAQTISADGARYANADESFIFWGKGNGAMVLEGGKVESYTGCIAVAAEPQGEGLSQVYANSGAGFSIRLAPLYSVDETYRYKEFGKGKEIPGIRFIVPYSFVASTTLSTDTYVSVELLPKVEAPARECSAALFLQSGKAETIVDNGVTLSFASSTDAAAGNRYEDRVYALPGTNPCIAVRYHIHSTVLENYPAGTRTAFDREALLKHFDAIRRTVVVVQ